jgi:hypothetical protein
MAKGVGKGVAEAVSMLLEALSTCKGHKKAVERQ